MKRIAMILTQDFEDSEAQKPYDSLKEAGHRIDIIGPEMGKELKGKKGQAAFQADVAVAKADAKEYDQRTSPPAGAENRDASV